MRINREEFLSQLESVTPGLSARDIQEQSSCFVFKNKNIYTFNDEIACTQKSLLWIEGAVPSQPLLSILRKLREDELEIALGEGTKSMVLLVKGKHRKAAIRMEQEILLPIKAIEKPREWKSLPADFANAISIVQTCAGSNEHEFALTCIHIDSKWIEACDRFQVARYKTKTDVSKSVLIRKDSLRHIVSLDMTEFSETRHWIHFRNSTGLTFSCRHFIEDYPTEDVKETLKMMKGEPLKLPRGLREAVEKAEVFSTDNAEGSNVSVMLRPGKFKITGEGALGWFTETKRSKYRGEPLQFIIPTRLLAELVKRYSKCEVTSTRLKVVGEKFVYITVLSKTKKEEDD